MEDLRNASYSNTDKILNSVSASTLVIAVLGGIAVAIIIAGMEGNKKAKSTLSGFLGTAGALAKELTKQVVSDNLTGTKNKVVLKAKEVGTHAFKG